MNPSRGGSYKQSFSDWVENKKTGTKPIDKKNHKCFQHAVTGALPINWKRPLQKKYIYIYIYIPFIDTYN